MNSGHYYSFIKAPNNCWYKADDDYVNLTGGDQALKQEAYVLFYIREDSVPIPPSTPKETPPSSNEPTPNPSQANSNPNPSNGLQNCSTVLDSMEVLNTKKRKVSIDESPNKHLKTSTGVSVRSSFSVVADLESIPTWKLEVEANHIEIVTQKKEQIQIATSHSQNLKSMQIQPKDEFDKQLDKGRTKKVKRKRALSFDNNQFQTLSNHRRSSMHHSQ